MRIRPKHYTMSKPHGYFKALVRRWTRRYEKREALRAIQLEAA